MDSADSRLARQQGTEPAATKVSAGSFHSAGAVADSILPTLMQGRPGIRTSELQTAWVHFLAGYEWQWFVTCTFREAVHPERADKAFRYWVGLLDEFRLGRKYKRSCHWHMRSRWVRALEWQKREVLHYHALVGNLEFTFGAQLMRSFWKDEWDRIGGFGRIDQVTQVGGVCGYVAKYVAKGGQVDCSPTLQRIRASA